MRVGRLLHGVVLTLLVQGSGACGSNDGGGSSAAGGSSGHAGTGSGGSLSTAGAGGSTAGGNTGNNGGSAGRAPVGGTGGVVGMAGAGGMSSTAGTAGAAGSATTAIGSGAALSSVLVGINYWNEPDIEALWSTVQASSVKLIRFGGAGADGEQPSNQRYADVAKAIQAIGATPYLQISRHFDAARAKQVVDFVNNQQALHVHYWSINNEPDIGANEPVMSVADSANLILTLAPAMKEADPSIVIFAPETAYYNTAYLDPMLGGANDITGKDSNGRYFIDGVSFHSYPFGATYDRNAATGAAGGLRNSVTALVAALAKANQKNNRTGAHALQWGLTEFNISYQNPANNGVDDFGVTSFLNGQFFAEVYGVGMAFGATTMDPWSVHESNGSRSAGDLGYLDGPLGSTKPRSSYYHLQMIAQSFAGKYAPATSTQPLVRVVAAGDGAHVSVLVMNESTDQSYDFALRLDNAAPMQQKAVTIKIDAALAAEYAGTAAPQSTTLYVFDATGKLTKRLEYAIADARAFTPPRDTTPAN